MSRQWRFKSVRTRQVFWFLTVALVPLLVVVGTVYRQRSTAIKQRELDKLQTIRDLKVREVNHWLDERTGDLEVAARDREVRGLESVLAKQRPQWAREDNQAVAHAQDLLHRYVDGYDAYSELFIVSALGGDVMIASDPSREGSHKRHDPYFTEVLRTGRPHIKGIYDSETLGRPSMTFSAPVFCLAHGGEHVIGVLVARIDLERSLYPLLQDRTGVGRTGETLIVNRDAMALNELRWYENAPLKLKISAEPAVRAARGETGVAETPDYRGEPVLAAYTHIPRTGWGFVAKRDLAEIYAPIRTMLREMAIILVISALIVCFVALLLSRLLAQPIVAIADTARCIREGDLSARCELSGADEVAALAASFNNMADTVAAQLQVQATGADIANTMVAATSVDEFASSLIATLMRVTDSNIGAHYQRGRSDRTFELLASVGLNADAPPTFDADSGEGEFGEALARRSICYTSNISDDTVFSFKAVAGTAMPREIVTVPLVAGDQTAAVLSLATLGQYTEVHHQILTQAHVVMSAALANLMASQQTERISETLQATNEELQATNEELRSQSDELRQQTEELEVQRQQVQEADQLKSEFLSNMSHELRTPLNSVLALSQLMTSRGLGQDVEQDTEYLRVIERNGRQLLDLINDILDLSKIEAGRQEILMAGVDPGEVAAAALATVGPLAKEKCLALTTRAADGLPTIHSDRDKVRQILLNLLSNAIKFTATGGVELAVAQTAGGVVFTVTDTGLGIAAGDLARIFDEFRQLDGSTTRRYGGTGLGLSISRRLAHLLGGELSVTSEPGEGSVFTLSLPLRCPDGTARPAEVAPRPLRSGRRREATIEGRPRILVVEDDEIAAIQMRSVLEACGCDVTVATCGSEGLAAVRQAVPDAMVLDLMMPDIDGFAVLEQIRSIPEARRLPVLVLTAKELTAADRARLSHNHIQELVQKGSLNRDELVERIAELIATAAQAEPAEPATDRVAIAMLPKGTTILVVEDNPDNLLTITAILDEMGAQHAAAADGENAVHLARQIRPDLILMDVQLPALSGLDATRQIKADPDLQGIPIIALTARAMTGDREEVLAAGCDDYVSKPIDPVALGRALRRWLTQPRKDKK